MVIGLQWQLNPTHLLLLLPLRADKRMGMAVTQVTRMQYKWSRKNDH